jgi:excisionase family DNA binding protein
MAAQLCSFPLPTIATVAYSRIRRRGVIPLTTEDITSARYLTVREVASTLRVSNMTVYRLINAGELPAVRVGKSFRLLEDDVNRYLADRYTQAG